MMDLTLAGAEKVVIEKVKQYHDVLKKDFYMIKIYVYRNRDFDYDKETITVFANGDKDIELEIKK